MVLPWSDVFDFALVTFRATQRISSPPWTTWSWGASSRLAKSNSRNGLSRTLPRTHDPKRHQFLWAGDEQVTTARDQVAGGDTDGTQFDRLPNDRTG